MKPRFLTTASAALVLTLAAFPALAAPGDIDTTFNSGVPAIIDPGSGNYLNVLAGAINPSNGDILFAGDYDTNMGAIAAYKPDGTLDTSVFGTGTTYVDPGAVGFPGGYLQFYAIAVDGQGRILLAGAANDAANTTNDMLLMRLKPDGTLDTNFGAGGTGFVLAQLDDYAEGEGLSLTADGHILVTGDAYDSGSSLDNLTVWRFSTDGTPDSGFGSSGHVQIAGITDSGYLGCKPALQPDGALLVGCGQESAQAWTATRLLPDGSVDTTFGNSGFVTGATGLYLYGLALAPDGGFIVSEADVNSPPPIDLRRYLADGSVDTAFNGGNPFDISTLVGTQSRLPVAVQPDGKMLLSANDGSHHLIVARLLADGTLDSGFGANGVGTVDFSNIGGSSYQSEPSSLLLQGDGKIVIVGYAVNTSDSRRISFVTRLDNDTFSFTPDAFSFMDKTGVSLSTLITSNAISVSGLSSNVSVPVSVSGGEYKVNSGAWTSDPGLVQNGDQVAVRHTSSGSYSTLTTTTLTIGGQAIPNNGSTVLGNAASASFTSTTKAKASGGGGGGGFNLLGLLGLMLLGLRTLAKKRQDA